GDYVSYAGRVIDSFMPGCWLDPGPFGCLGTGPGYALAAKLARPEQQVVMLLGDGAFGFSGMEFDTLVRHGVAVVGVMGNNGIWGLEKHPMEFLYGYSVAAELRPETRYDQVVEALGAQGELVTQPLVDGGPRGRGACHGDSAPDRRALGRGQRPLEDRARVERKRLELRLRRRIGADVTLAHAHDPDGQRGVKAGRVILSDDELGGASADVHHDGRPLRRRHRLPAGHRAEERQLRLFIAAQHARVEAELLTHPRGERLAVGGVAHGSRHHSEIGLAAVGVDFAAVVVQRSDH